jgi:hypothetical protein
MKTILSIAFSLLAAPALAHPALAPHDHPHGWSLLPGVELIGLGMIALMLAIVVIGHLRRG